MRWFDLSRDFLKGQSWRIKLNFECSKCFLSAKIFCIFCQFLRYLCSVSACPRMPHMLTHVCCHCHGTIYIYVVICVSRTAGIKASTHSWQKDEQNLGSFSFSHHCGQALRGFFSLAFCFGECSAAHYRKQTFLNWKQIKMLFSATLVSQVWKAISDCYVTEDDWTKSGVQTEIPIPAKTQTTAFVQTKMPSRMGAVKQLFLGFQAHDSFLRARKVLANDKPARWEKQLP